MTLSNQTGLNLSMINKLSQPFTSITMWGFSDISAFDWSWVPFFSPPFSVPGTVCRWYYASWEAIFRSEQRMVGNVCKDVVFIGLCIIRIKFLSQNQRSAHIFRRHLRTVRQPLGSTTLLTVFKETSILKCL